MGESQEMSKVTIRRAMARMENINIFYRDTGNNAQPILCLHGRWGRGETWVDFMQHYGKAYRVIAPDLRGHGLSGRPMAKYTADEFSSDMTALMDYLDIHSAIVVGHSMGGHIAGHLAAAHPEYAKALAILDKSAAGPEKENGLPPEKLECIDPVTKSWPLPFKSLSEAQAVIRRDMESELSYQYFMNSLMETEEGYGMMFSAQAIAANIAYYSDWYHLLPRIPCPVLLIRAKGNGAVSETDFHKMKSMIPNCTACEMSDPDHNVHLANKAEFYGYFDEFLEKAAGKK
jgi:pimeloyl-ACP methyl ester carboxylesterase